MSLRKFGTDSRELQKTSTVWKHYSYVHSVSVWRERILWNKATHPPAVPPSYGPLDVETRNRMQRRHVPVHILQTAPLLFLICTKPLMTWWTSSWYSSAAETADKLARVHNVATEIEQKFLFQHSFMDNSKKTRKTESAPWAYITGFGDSGGETQELLWAWTIWIWGSQVTWGAPAEEYTGFQIRRWALGGGRWPRSGGRELA
jgi:hypothetical protein